MSEEKFRVLLFDTKYRNPNHYICLALFAALKRHPSVEFVAKADPLDAIGLAARNRCNLFIAFDGEELDRQLCTRLAALCGRSVLWVTEDPYELETNLHHARIFDVVFSNDSSSVSAYGERGRHLPLAGATDFHMLPVRDVEEPLRYELFFAGTAWPNRSDFVRTILDGIPPEWKFKLALPTNPFLPPHGVALPESTLAWRTSPVDFARFVNRSAITLLLPRVFSASGGREYAETPPPRLFEAALAGGVQMVHESLTEVVQSFRRDDEIVMFSSESDFLGKARDLVEDRARRNRIASAAQERALGEHTYDRRVDTILKEARCIARPVVRADLSQPRTLLLVAHNVAQRGNFGGVEVYLERIRKALGSSWNVLFYVPGKLGDLRRACLLDGDYNEIKTFTFSKSYSPALLSCPEREKAFRTVLIEYGVDLVHFHHFIGHVPSMVHVASQLGVPSALTAHDFFPVCHEFNLLSFKSEFCGAPNVTLAQCDVCLWHKHEIVPGSQAQRRMFWDSVLRHVELLIFNTEGTRHTYAATFPAVRAHAGARILPVPVLDGPVRRRRRGEGALKIAILGNVTFQKGGDVLGRVLPLFQGAPVEFHVFGRVDGQYGHLARADVFHNLTVHGPYSIDAPPPSLLDCDVSLHVSIWPETYCLTLSEAWQLGLVPIVTDIGALGERVEHMVNGLKIPPNREGALVDSIRRLIDEPELLALLQERVSEGAYAQLTHHIAQLSEEYRAVLRVSHFPSERQAPIRHPALADMGVVLQSPTWHRGGEDEEIAGTGAAKLVGKARKLGKFYRRHGLRPTLRIVANRFRSIL